MKKILGLMAMLCIMTAFAVCVHAEDSGTCGDNLTWTLSDSGVLTISGTGDMYDYEIEAWNSTSVRSTWSSTAPWSYKGIKNVIVENGVTSIGAYAFADEMALTNISIPASVTKLNDNYYTYQTRIKSSPLEGINVASSNTAYASIDGILYNKDLTTLIQCPRANKISVYNAPSSLKTIKEKAFYLQQNLTKVIMNDGAIEIGNRAFGECYNLKEAQLSKTVQSFEYAFYSCKNLESVQIPYGVTEISSNAFNSCPSLVQINLPDSVKNIEEEAFNGCYSLTVIIIPDSVQTIDRKAFSGCSALSNITIPNGVKTIKSGAFSGVKIEYIKIPESVETIESGSKYSYWAYNGAFDYCRSLKTADLSQMSSSITSIPGRIFADCTSLTDVYIPNTITKINSEAFLNCNELTDVYFNGTESEWNAINILSGNDPLLTATIHFKIEPCFTISQTTNKAEITNTDISERTANVIIAEYQNGALKDVSSQTVTFAAGEKKTYNFSGGSYKVLVWNSLSGMCPLNK